VHEEWHLKNGEDEKGAYEAQLTELARLGSGAGTAVYAQVSQSMRAVLKARAIPERTAMLAAR